MIRLFELQGHKVVPTEHCYIIKWLKVITDNYPQDVSVNIFAYIFYMTCPSQDNPFYNVPEEALEDYIMKEIDINFDPEDDIIQNALRHAEKLYETPTTNAYKSMKKMLENLSEYLRMTKITDGRDGNISAMLQAAKNFDAIRQSFKGVKIDLEEEQETHVLGSKKLGYDQM